jgi:hypothetical protein
MYARSAVAYASYLGNAIARLVGILVYVTAVSIVWLEWLIISVGAAAGVSLFLLPRISGHRRRKAAADHAPYMLRFPG